MMPKRTIKIIFTFFASITVLATNCVTDEQMFVEAQNKIAKQGFFPAAAIVAATLDAQEHIQVTKDFDPTQINQSLIEQYFIPTVREIFASISTKDPLLIKVANEDNTGFDDGTITKATIGTTNITFDLNYEGQITDGSKKEKKLMTETNISFFDYNQPIFYDTKKFKKQVPELNTHLEKIISYMS